MDKLNFMCSMD